MCAPDSPGRRRVLLLGDPVEHSLSAVFQNAGFLAAGIDACYELRQVVSRELARTVDEIRLDVSILGANVTVPHKGAIVPLLDRLEADAVRLGSVNTISREGNDLVGWNTDRAGFARALKEAGYDPQGRSALVLGAGGAARAVTAALLDQGALILVASRRLEQAAALCRDLGVPGEGAVSITSLPAALSKASLVVNATPVGLDGRTLPFAPELLRAGQFVFDLIYNPPITPLLAAARARGLATSNGLAMLLYQGAAAFEIWTGRPAPEPQMREALA